jgi:hypothetical protein
MVPHDEPFTAYLPTPSPNPEFGTSQDDTLNHCAPETSGHLNPHNCFCAVANKYWCEYDAHAPRFIDMAYVSNVVSVLRDKMPCGTQTKGSIRYPEAFTGRDIVVRSQPYFFPAHHESSHKSLDSHPILHTSKSVQRTPPCSTPNIAKLTLPNPLP